MDITGTWDQCRKHVYGLLDTLFGNVEKIQEQDGLRADRLSEVESKCKRCDPSELHLRLMALETQCRECKARRSFWHVGLKDLTIGVLVAIIGGMALWYFTRGG